MYGELIFNILVEISSYPDEFLDLRDLIIFSVSFVIVHLLFIVG
jgi:hypothetical protein